MKYVMTLLLFSSLFLGSGCKDDKEGQLTLHFKAVYDGEVLPTFSTRAFDGVQQVQFTHLSMLLADLQLLHGTATENLSDVELIDLSFDELAKATDGYTLTIRNIPARTYEGIRFGVGLPADLNAKKPADFVSSSPLSKTGYYWLPWSSYIFMKVEGRMDTLGSGLFDTGFVFHTGSNPLYRILEGTLPLTIEDGRVTDLTIHLDYKKLLEGIDIKSNPQNHNPEDTEQILKLVNNLGNAVVLLQ